MSRHSKLQMKYESDGISFNIIGFPGLLPLQELERLAMHRVYVLPISSTVFPMIFYLCCVDHSLVDWVLANVKEDKLNPINACLLNAIAAHEKPSLKDLIDYGKAKGFNVGHYLLSSINSDDWCNYTFNELITHCKNKIKKHGKRK
jgi:hypothetical protein